MAKLAKIFSYTVHFIAGSFSTCVHLHVPLCYWLNRQFISKFCYILDVFLYILATSFQAAAPPTGANLSLTLPLSTLTTFTLSFSAPLTPHFWRSSSGGHPCSLSYMTGTVVSYAIPIPPYLEERVRILCLEHMLLPEAVSLVIAKKLKSLGIHMESLALTSVDSCLDKK